MRVSIFLLALLFVSIASCREDSMSKLPEFDLLLSDSTTVFNTGSIPKGKVSMIVHFDSECGDCQNEMDSIIRNYDQFRDVNMYFLTVESIGKLRIWEDHFKLKQYNNIITGKDTKQYFPKYYKNRHTPLMAIYTKERRLEGIYVGKPQMNTLITKLNGLK